MKENPLTMEMLLDQLIGLNIIELAAIPMILLVVLEWILTIVQKKDYYNSLDTVSATFIGLVNVGISALLKIGIFATMLFFYNVVPWSIPREWWAYILCIITIDFFRYWSHRLTHVNRFWWATHVTHHNSEKYNLSVAFRLGWTQHIKFIFFIPIVLMGFDPVLFFICHQIEVLYQFWIHTEYIRKLPAPLEYIFVTPSHHRVHHSTNDKYLDKNFGSTLIIWDRIFGTFEAEEEQTLYGITVPINSYNPITLNFHEWKDISSDVIKSRSLKEAYAMLFTSPSKLEAVKTEFNSINFKVNQKEESQSKKPDFIKVNKIVKTKDKAELVEEQVL
ncbi:sterol desaturase family protein [Flavobacterium degerlachei]|jgi:sterol desaturase/sphingolipid hydroxylase (fatty acid hydroxylase superfamily)|uniref:Sterol desaturase/sphingolipid hydroxylase, fatty acid hydroxylase superfamily n=1 Tax=Flavobacterium degerlachei TaxID=229203 RepID=A0A1H2SF81_9FLAO|nr:sterol desaturase family protein [Flavobacterium degerlachei]SDW30260.1 Sterol desaturase/sphingolipid hydroxylase, fatty acid hydroxylase superfamily [Flavobacterium degerlachei]